MPSLIENRMVNYVRLTWEGDRINWQNDSNHSKMAILSGAFHSVRVYAGVFVRYGANPQASQIFTSTKKDILVLSRTTASS
jgi:hypothetical protein